MKIKIIEGQSKNTYVIIFTKLFINKTNNNKSKINNE